MKPLPICLIVLAASIAAAATQQPRSGVSFEVASIRPGARADAEQIPIRMNFERSMIHYVNASLRDCIRVAYGVKEFQISGPDWLGKRFNIEAKYPAGATEDQVPEMLQALLRDRFKLQLHREEKEHAIYALVVGKNGPKLKLTKTLETDYPDSPDRRPGTPVRGDLLILGSPSGMRLQGLGVTLSKFSETLSLFTNEPVINQTGLEGRYDIDIVFLPENRRLMRAQPGAPGREADGGADTSSEPRDTVFEAMQRWGLKLEARRAPLALLVVDHLEKAPTEN